MLYLTIIKISYLESFGLSSFALCELDALHIVSNRHSELGPSLLYK